MEPDLRDSKVLIVDDDPVNLRLLVDYLKKAGFKTLVAASGEWALEQVEQIRPDIILLDIMMEGIDGFETCRRLKQNSRTSSIPLIFITALSDTDQKIRGFKAGAIDYITKPFHQEEVLARITTHLTLQKQKSDLQELNFTKNKFFSLIAHDLKNSLSSVLGYAETLSSLIQQCSPEEIQEFRCTIKESAESLLQLLENLLHWSKSQTGTIQFNPQKLSLRSLMNGTYPLFKSNLDLKKQVLLNEISSRHDVYADRDMVNTILRNLLSNAFFFTETRGQIRVYSKDQGNFIEVSVEDTGVGIAPEFISRLFRLEFHHTELASTPQKGSGLGLILCREFVEKEGGKIGARSQLGQGSTFFFTLPKF